MVFVKREIFSSTSQLEADFCEYPPAPLIRPALKPTQFYRVQAAHFNRYLYLLFQIFRSLISGGDSNSEFNAEVNNLRLSITKILVELPNEFFKIKESCPSKLLFLFIISSYILVVFLFIPVLVLVFLYSVTAIFISILRGRLGNSLGYFVPIQFNGMPEIVVHGTLIPKETRTLAIAAICSHEHIHLRQSIVFASTYNPCRTNSAFEGRKGELIKALINSPDEDFSSFSYYALLNEMEARLHEVVLSYYRKYRILPTSYHSFIELLMGSKNLGELTRLYDKTFGDKSQLYSQMPYEVRYEPMEWQILSVINRFKDHKHSYRYITEVLPVMYRNLLMLYGGEQEASEFIKTVPCHDFYIDLYGEVTG
ncbi:hypothetical protein [Shewanella baltica]|uniref:hypothetical protein n=2 Tax=Shewanella baltica TaxID=62322 RepID=UPI000E07E523|nr:hypothetical protein [Shewanella baltica]SUI61401.1 Uncharacterised protein [Shewanella baltica]